MLLSDDKINHISHLILDGLGKNPDVSLVQAKEKILRQIKKALFGGLQLEEDIDEFVRKKLASYSRRLPEGSPEWNVLYKKFFEEELDKKKR